MSLSRHPNRREFDHLGRLFGLLADDPNIEKILVKEVEKSDILKDFECDDLSYEDWDEDGPAGGTVDPAVETTLVYELHEGGWIPKLRKVSRKFDELCDRFLSLYAAGFPKKSPSALKRESLEALDEFLGDHFWGEMPEELDGDLFTETYDEMRYECWDAAEERRDPYGYRGLSRRDFMASDRSRLIRLASTMAVGTPERKAILKGLSKRADLVGDLEAEFDSILAGHDANLDAATDFGMRSAHKRVAKAYRLTQKEISRADEVVDSQGNTRRYTIITRPQAGGGVLVAAIDVDTGQPWGPTAPQVVKAPGRVDREITNILRWIDKMGWTSGMASSGRMRRKLAMTPYEKNQKAMLMEAGDRLRRMYDPIKLAQTIAKMRSFKRMVGSSVDMVKDALIALEEGGAIRVLDDDLFFEMRDEVERLMFPDGGRPPDAVVDRLARSGRFPTHIPTRPTSTNGTPWSRTTTRSDQAAFAFASARTNARASANAPSRSRATPPASMVDPFRGSLPDG